MKAADRIPLPTDALVTSLSTVGADELLVSFAASPGKPRLASCPLDNLGMWRPIDIPAHVVPESDDVLCARRMDVGGIILLAHTSADEPVVVLDEATRTTSELAGPRWVEWLSPPHGRRFVLSGEALTVWDANASAIALQVAVDEGRDNAPARGVLSADGAVLAAAAHRPGIIELISLPDGSMLHRFEGGPKRAGWIGFAPQDRLLLVLAKFGESAQLWDSMLGQRLATETFNDDAPRLMTAAFHPNGEVLAVGSRYGVIDIVRLPSGEIVASENVHHGRVSALLVPESGEHLLSGGEDGYLQVWEL